MKRNFAKIMILVTVIFMDILGGAEVDLFVPSFPELKNHFSLSSFWVETLLSINFIGYCLSLFFVGGLADHYGRKPVIVLGLIIFIIGSMFCLWGELYQLLLIGRFLQGLGVAAPACICFLIIADSYSLKKQQYLMSMLNGITNVAVAGAPVIGSYITIYFHWQGNFMVLLLLGIIVLIMTIFFIPNYQLSEHKEPISLSGYIPILQSKPLILLIINIVFLFVPYWIFLGMSSLLYVEDLGVSLAHFGYYQGAWALVFALGSILSVPIINKYDQKKILYFSGQLCIVSLIIIAVITYLDTRNPLLIALAFLPFGIATIIPASILYPLCLNFMPKAKARVSALFQAVRLIITAIGLELTGYYYKGSFQNIGIIISFIIVIGIITLFLVINNRQLMQLQEGTNGVN